MNQPFQISKQGLAVVLAIMVIISGILGGYIGQNYPLPGSKAQGVGISSFGPNFFLITQNDTTVNRAFNTTYRNGQGTGQAMLVTIMLRLNTTATAGSITAATAFISTQPTGQFCNCWTSPSNGFHHAFSGGIGYNYTGAYGIVAQENTTVISQGRVTTMHFWVPSMFYYQVNSTRTNGGLTQIKQWLETVPPTGFGQIIAAVIESMRRITFA